MTGLNTFNRQDLTLVQKVLRIRWLFVGLLCAVAGVGAAMLYSAADGHIEPWAMRHLIRFGVALALMLIVAFTDIRLWLRYAYGLYGAAFVMLVMVEVGGSIGMGAQRWIDLGVIHIQPSELMKVTLVLALARYFHARSLDEVRRISQLILPAAMIVLPAALVLRQPDLGTALMLIMAGGAVLFTAGVPAWMFAAVGLVGMAVLPIAWQFLHDYQQQRVLTFLDPESDPLGAGYHILQSKIALGAGGIYGRGFMLGTQSHLNFLPEKQTDFIFTMFAEEFGLTGALALLGLYTLILMYCFAIALACRNQFGRLVAVGVTTTFFLYLFINMAMVMGLIPVVGVPLPLVSYGGTAVLSLMIGFGLLLSVHVHRDVMIGRHSVGEST